MLSQIYYLIRSKKDGQYLAARPQLTAEQSTGYLLMFRADYEAFSYLNTHGAEIAEQFAVESIPGDQLASILKRWGFTGIAMVNDPLIPDIEFLTQK